MGGTAHTSHNGYLDLALTIGLPDYFWRLIAFLIVPLYNFHHTLHQRPTAASPNSF